MLHQKYTLQIVTQNHGAWAEDGLFHQFLAQFQLSQASL
jgi:hypothetical protein